MLGGNVLSRDYKSSGVDVEAGYAAVALMKDHVMSTYRKEVISDIGGFGGLFSISAAKDMQEPVLVSGTDSVGTKVKIAFLLDKHTSIGIDCVAMCVNDIICCGAEPLFFLDYIACGKTYPEKVADIVKGVAEGCRMSGAALLGGETAEMPGLYKENEYDVAGFATGIADKANLINGSTIKAGDCVIGLASSGLHSNGYSLVRKLLRPSENNLQEYIQTIGSTLGEELLKPTRIYVKSILALRKTVDVKGIANITGGGFIENIPRIIPDGLSADIKLGTWDVPPIFKLLQNAGELNDKAMLGIFNMGIGMVVVVDKADSDKTVTVLSEQGEKPYIIGEIAEGNGIKLC